MFKRKKKARSLDANYIAEQAAWAEATFGPRHLRGPHGPLDHLKKELVEVEENIYDLEEWSDILILGFDGATRAGHSPQEIIDCVLNKFEKNKERDWPDWRGRDLMKAIEHIRDKEKNDV